MKKSVDLPLFQPEEPTSFDVLEGMISKTATTEYTGALRSISVRFPLVDYCTVEAMSQYSGQSKNKIVIQMVSVAIERLNQELPKADLKAIQAIRSKLIGEMLDAETKAQIISGNV
jgi:hypothetical protein